MAENLQYHQYLYFIFSLQKGRFCSKMFFDQLTLDFIFFGVKF